MLRFNSQESAPLLKQAKDVLISFTQKQVSFSTLKEIYQRLYELVEANEEDHFILTSSGSESVNHVVFAAYVDITRKTGKNHFVCSNIDEAPAVMAMNRLQEMGCVFQMAPADERGVVTAEALSETLSPRTALVSLSWANGLTGVIQPVQEIAKICRERGVLFHVDATHVLGKGDYTFENSGADFLTFNGEQIHGPIGSGGLFIRSGLDMSSLILGGNEQGNRRGGSLNIAVLAALSEAAKEAKNQMDHLSMEIARLRALFEKEIVKKIKGAKVLFSQSPRVPHITSFTFPGVSSDALLYLLNQKNLYASFGGGNFQHFPHILKACKIKEPLAHCGLSFGLCFETELDDIEKGVDLVEEACAKLQKHARYLMDDEEWH